MSAREVNLINELRKKELKSLSDADFKMVMSEVEDKGIRGLKGSAAQIVFRALRERDKAMEKATSVRVGDMVRWNSSGGQAEGKVEHIMREGVLGVPKSKFSIKAEEGDPAVLIRIYRDGEETETLVGHKMSTLRKELVAKHFSHDQSSHGNWAGQVVAEMTDDDRKLVGYNMNRRAQRIVYNEGYENGAAISEQNKESILKIHAEKLKTNLDFLRATGGKRTMESELYSNRVLTEQGFVDGIRGTRRKYREGIFGAENPFYLLPALGKSVDDADNH